MSDKSHRRRAGYTVAEAIDVWDGLRKHGTIGRLFPLPGQSEADHRKEQLEHYRATVNGYRGELDAGLTGPRTTSLVYLGSAIERELWPGTAPLRDGDTFTCDDALVYLDALRRRIQNELTGKQIGGGQASPQKINEFISWLSEKIALLESHAKDNGLTESGYYDVWLDAHGWATDHLSVTDVELLEPEPKIYAGSRPCWGVIHKLKRLHAHLTGDTGRDQAGGEQGERDNSNRRKGIPRAEAEIRVREWLAANAKDNPAGITRDAVAHDTGVSAGNVSKTTAWKAFRERRDAEAKPGTREVPLTDPMKAAMPSDCEKPDELAALIEEQKKEEAEQKRRHERRHERRHGPS